MATLQKETEKTEITRIRQEDFLAQLAQILAQYDKDGDGLLSEEDWSRVEADLAQKSA